MRGLERFAAGTRSLANRGRRSRDRRAEVQDLLYLCLRNLCGSAGECDEIVVCVPAPAHQQQPPGGWPEMPEGPRGLSAPAVPNCVTICRLTTAHTHTH